MGVGTGVVGLAPSNFYLMALGGMALAGLMSPIANGSIFAMLQSTVPLEKQGRVFTLMMSGSAAMAPIGLAMAGPLTDIFGVRIWFLARATGLILENLHHVARAFLRVRGPQEEAIWLEYARAILV
jgi:MFS family permease